ncbi:MAG: translocation/assembly module TamB, partial [Deltaproteobacteria bacterium]|nr:translocation/assembly module TamB [Deltaproteobacteria bacterium]
MTPASFLRPRRLLLLAALLCVLAPWALGTRYASEQACAAAKAQLPLLLGAEVAIGRCELEPFSGGVVLQHLQVRPLGTEAGAPPLFAAEEAALSGAWLRPEVRALELGRLRLIRPRVYLDLRRERPASARAPACPLEPLKRVEVAALSVQDASVEVLLPGERAVRVAGLQLSATQVRGDAEFELSAKGAEVVPAAGQAALPLSRLLLRGTFSPRDERVEFRRAEVGMDAALLSWTGAVETLCTPELALEAQLYLPVATAAKAVLLPTPLGGHGWARVSLS